FDFRICVAAAAYLEPGMLVGCVRQNLVDHDLETEPMRLGHQRVEIGQRAEHGVDIAIVGDVVAKILHRRVEEGGNPDGVHAEVGDIGQTSGYAPEVAYPIAIRVLEGARIDLIDHRPAPPVAVGRLHGNLGFWQGALHNSPSFSRAGQQAAHKYACNEKKKTGGTMMKAKAEVVEVSRSPPH